MKKNKLIMLGVIAFCSVLIAVVMAIAFNQPEDTTKPHIHSLGEARTYHITNNGVYYTLACKHDDYSERFETSILLDDVLVIADANDKIVLDEDIVLDHIIAVNSFVNVDGFPEGREVNINLDLNNYSLTTSLTGEQTQSISSVFVLNASYGTINFNVSNGKIYTDELLYIFNFINNKMSGQSISVKIDNVECKVSGNNVTPLYAHKNSTNIKLTATDSEFIAEKPSTATTNTGVGAFINSDSEFNFNNCNFVGGDAINVKRGTVNLNNCELISKEHVWIANSESAIDSFNTMGACLLADSYHESATAGYTKFIVNIRGCSMTSLNSSKMICVIETATSGLEKGVNGESQINVESCTFNKKPSTEFSIVNYNTTPVNENNEWIVR